jgi:hypothetical protein
MDQFHLDLIIRMAPSACKGRFQLVLPLVLKGPRRVFARGKIGMAIGTG